MSFPVHDWQFWVVTALAAGALGWLLREVAPVRSLKERRRRKAQQRRAALTIEGRPVRK